MNKKVRRFEVSARKMSLLCTFTIVPNSSSISVLFFCVHFSFLFRCVTETVDVGRMDKDYHTPTDPKVS